MKTNLYIPKTITIGYQKRRDTFTGMLAYVIYTDHKGVLRKEKSWESWRDKTIPSITIDNAPQPGFTLNKGVQRDGYWGSGRSVIRVWDPRDFEFEISIDNLIGILMHSDVSKRDITQDCVYAWNGTELVLLPTNSVEYQESVAHTAKQEVKFSAKDLVVGHSYSVRKTHETVVYLGRFDRYAIEQLESTDRYFSIGVKQVKLPSKKHVFINPKTFAIEPKDPATFISNVEDSNVHPDYASLLDRYYSQVESQQLVGLSTKVVSKPYYGYSSESIWVKLTDTEFMRLEVAQIEYRFGNELKRAVISFSKFARVEGQTINLSHGGRDGYGYHYNRVSPHKLPGLDVTNANVQQLLTDLTDLYHEVITTKLPVDKSQFNTELAKRLYGDFMQQAFDKFSAGSLIYVLADGKTTATSTTSYYLL